MNNDEIKKYFEEENIEVSTDQANDIQTILNNGDDIEEVVQAYRNSFAIDEIIQKYQQDPLHLQFMKRADDFSDLDSYVLDNASSNSGFVDIAQEYSDYIKWSWVIGELGESEAMLVRAWLGEFDADPEELGNLGDTENFDGEEDHF